MTMTARTSKASFGTGGRVAVVAGSGLLPAYVIDALASAGHRPVVVAIAGEADIADAPARYDLLTAAVDRLGFVLPELRKRGVTHLVMAGGVAKRPPLSRLRFPPSVLLQIPRLIAAYARGDDGLLRATIGYIESSGIQVVGAHEVVPDLLAPAGTLGKIKPGSGDRKDIAAAFAAARAIGALDIGQAAIAIGGRAVALEGIEGTDGLLERMKDLRGHGRLAGKARGALVKCAKPGQEERADLPSIGPRTMTAARAAGLGGVAVEAGRSLILDMAETIRLADELGLYLVGLEGEPAA
ncbi:LpxI family protein [Nitratireductor thuwali]|uniref:Phosphatidate cytidylyltransferase n=1 Tax=Nitratireductor thuwali TaxID=2267699 RepID=A0ABY5MEW2_9HYPH|nr:hypothetical protein NTH_00228 [Nitratireductor thuwali]